jgi:aspartate/methionine/tyrosine aminotransferase
MREANKREAAGEDIIHMEVGQPGTPAPRLVREAVKRALDQAPLGYTDALGLPTLREKIAAYYRDVWNVTVPPSRIVITTGSSAGFVLAFLALLNPGDGIAIPEPGYPCYRQIARVLGVRPVSLAARAEKGFMPSADDLRDVFKAGLARAALLASPANPTGAALSALQLRGLINVANEFGAWFISDEIYHGLTYVEPAATALAFSVDAIIINSFSKYFSMTGWRIGWMVVPERLIRVFERLAQNLYISPPAISQVAAIAAFDSVDELEAYKAVYAQNRALLLEELPKAGISKLAPADGAFYIYADISAFTDDSESFVRRMMKEIGVAATPGVDFDEAAGRHFMRFSYAGTHDNMREAMRRIQAWRAIG